MNKKKYMKPNIEVLEEKCENSLVTASIVADGSGNVPSVELEIIDENKHDWSIDLN